MAYLYIHHKQIPSVNGIYSDAGMNRYTFDRCSINSTITKLLLLIKYNPGISRKEVQIKLNAGYIPAKCYSSYNGGIWRFLLSHDYIRKDYEGKQVKYYILREGEKVLEKILQNKFTKKG